VASGHSTPAILKGLQQQQQALLPSSCMLESHTICHNSSTNPAGDSCTRKKNSHMPLRRLVCTAGNSRRHVACARTHTCNTALCSAALQL
jgi:hypothetical protein